MDKIQNSRIFSEIHQQPDVIRELVTHPQDSLKALVEQIRSRGIHHVLIAARGTSKNAGRYAQYLLGAHNQLAVGLTTPSLFTIYKQPPNLSDTLVIGISQSGKSPDIVSVIEEGHRQGALTAAITNIPDSDLGNAADFVLNLKAGEEKSLAATKTYTAQLTLVALLSTELNPTEQAKQELLALPDQMAINFANEAMIKDLVERYRYMTNCVILGRGFNYATAYELSIKIKELTYTVAEPYSPADFAHGPIAVIDRGFPAIVFAPSGKMLSEMKNLIGKLHDRLAEVITISDQEEILELGDRQITLPVGVPEWLSPIAAIPAGQMFAMYLSHTRGINVDSPRGLSKITETW